MKDYAKASKGELIREMNIVVNKTVYKMGKKIEQPFEVEFFPREQIPRITVQFYREVLKKKKLPTLLPPRDTLLYNVTLLLRHTEPELLKEIHKRRIDILQNLMYDVSRLYGE